MAATRQNGAASNGQRIRGDLIAPEVRGHVVHFRPVFSGMQVMDAEYEDIGPEEQSGGPGDPVSTGGAASRRFDATTGSVNFGDRTIRVAAATAPPKLNIFYAAAAALCALSFWVFGGHAVLAGIAARDTDSTTVAADQAARRVRVVDDIVTGTTPAIRRHRDEVDGFTVVDRSGGSN